MTARCSFCGHERPVRADGRLRKHAHPITHRGCPGAGKNASTDHHVHHCADCAAVWDEEVYQ